MDEALRVGGDLGMETPLNASKSGYTSTLEFGLLLSALL